VRRKRSNKEFLKRQSSNFFRKSIVEMSRASFSTWGKMTGGESANNNENEALEELDRQENENIFDEEQQ